MNSIRIPFAIIFAVFIEISSSRGSDLSSVFKNYYDGKDMAIHVSSVLSNATSVSLKGMELCKIPQWLKGANITYLDLSNNQIELSASDYEILASIKKLVSLNLSGNRISKIDGAILSMTNTQIETVMLLGNNISHVSDQISELNSLKAIYLSSNLLAEIPKGIMKSKSIICLNLSNNRLMGGLPYELTNMTSLTLLDVGLNHISDVDVSNLPASLRELNLKYNMIQGDDVMDGSNTNLVIYTGTSRNDEDK